LRRLWLQHAASVIGPGRLAALGCNFQSFIPLRLAVLHNVTLSI